MATIQKGDFVEIDYTGQTIADEVVFDTTEKVLAHEHDLDEKRVKGPLTICVGEGHIMRSLDQKLEGVEVGGSYSYDFAPDQAFGKKNAKLLRLIPLSKFREQKVMPHPHLQVNIDGAVGTVRSATSGRVIVDFNHPLSGRDIRYTVKVIRKVDDPSDQIRSLIRTIIGIPQPVVSIAEGKAVISVPFVLPPEAQKSLVQEIKRLVKISDVVFALQK